MSTTDAIGTFSRRVTAEWLPTYCADSARNYSVEGFKLSSMRVSEIDAIDCMRAIDTGVVNDHGGGRYMAARSAVREVLFWEGRRKVSPRPITLWIEPVITIAAAARLHHEFGWPKGCIGLQSKKWGFDFVAYASEQDDREYIVGEVKKTARELQTLIHDLQSLGLRSLLGEGANLNVKPNSRKKWDELLQRQPKILWALGPNRSGAVFTLAYPSKGGAVLTEAASSALSYENAA